MSINSRPNLNPNQILTSGKSSEPQKCGNTKTEGKATAAELSRKVFKSPCSDKESDCQIGDNIYTSMKKIRVDYRSHQKIDNDKSKLILQTRKPSSSQRNQQLYDPQIHKNLFTNPNVNEINTASKSLADRRYHKSILNKDGPERSLGGVNDFTKPPEYPIFSESESNQLPFEFNKYLPDSGMRNHPNDPGLLKEFCQISDIRVSKNTVASHFGKSNLFDLTLSNAFSNNNNIETGSKVNSVERSGQRARNRASSKHGNNQRPTLRHSHNSQNRPGRHSSKSRETDKVDVEDYWAKWLEFKENNQIRKTNMDEDFLSRSSQNLDLKKFKSQRPRKSQELDSNQILESEAYCQIEDNVVKECPKSHKQSQMRVERTEYMDKSIDLHSSKDRYQGSSNHARGGQLSAKEDRPPQQFTLHSPQGYQGEQKYSNPVIKGSKDLSSRVSSYPVPQDYDEQQKEIENYIMATNLRISEAQTTQNQSQVIRRQVPFDSTNEYRKQLFLDTQAIKNIQSANLRELDFNIQQSQSPFQANVNKISHQSHSEDVESEKTQNNFEQLADLDQVDQPQHDIGDLVIDRKTLDIMHLMNSELNHMNSFKQAQQCLQRSIAKRNITETQDECHSVIREENSPDIEYQEENVPDDSVDHKIRNSDGSSMTSDRSVCEEFVPDYDQFNNENLRPFSQDGESEYRVPAEIKSFVVASSLEQNNRKSTPNQNVKIHDEYTRMPSTPELESETSQRSGEQFNENSSETSIISSRQLDEHQNKSLSKSISRGAIDYSYLVIGQKQPNQSSPLRIENVQSSTDFGQIVQNLEQPQMNKSTHNFNKYFLKLGFLPDMSLENDEVQSRRDLTNREQDKGGALEKGQSMLMSYLTNFNSKSARNISELMAKGDSMSKIAGGISSLLIKAEDQEYNSNSVSKNLNCRASRGRLQETKAKAQGYRNMHKMHKSCDNLKGFKLSMPLNSMENSMIAHNQFARNLRQSLNNGMKAPLTVRSRQSGLSQRSREQKLRSSLHLDRDPETQQSQRSLSQEMNRNQLLKKQKQNISFNMQSKQASQLGGINYYSCRNIPSISEIKQDLMSPLYSTSKINGPATFVQDRSGRIANDFNRRMNQLYCRPNYQPPSHRSNQPSVAHIALRQQMKKSLSISGVTAQTDTQKMNTILSNSGFQNQSSMTQRRMPFTNADNSEQVTEGVSANKKSGQFLTFDIRQDEANRFQTQMPQGDSGRRAAQNHSSSKKYPPRPPSTSGKKHHAAYSQREDDGLQLYYKSMPMVRSPQAADSSQVYTEKLQQRLSAKFNEPKEKSDSKTRKETYNRESYQGMPTSHDHDSKKYNSFGIPNSGLKNSSQNSKMKSATTEGEDCLPIDDESPINAQNLMVSREKGAESGEITETIHEIDSKSPCTSAKGNRKSGDRCSQLTANRQRVQSITNYYNILNQHMQDKMLQETKQSNSIEKVQTVIGENTCSHVQIDDVNSPNIQNLQALTINYNSNQNYQSINFYDEVNRDNNAATRLSKKESSGDTVGVKDSFQNRDYSNQFSTIKRCQQNQFNPDKDDDVIIRTERNGSNVDSFLVQVGSAESQNISKNFDQVQSFQGRPLLSFEKIKNIESSLSTLRVANGQVVKQDQKSPELSESMKVNEECVDWRNMGQRKEGQDSTVSVSHVKNELSQGVSVSKQAKKKYHSRSPALVDAGKGTRHIMITLNSGEDEQDCSQKVYESNHYASKQVDDKVNATHLETKLDSPYKVSHSLTQNLSYRMNAAAKSPNNKSFNNKSVNLRSYRSQNSELSEFYDHYSKNSNHDSRKRMHRSMNKRKRLKQSRNQDEKPNLLDKFQTHGTNQDIEQTILLSQCHLHQLNHSKSGNFEDALQQRQKIASDNKMSTDQVAFMNSSLGQLTHGKQQRYTRSRRSPFNSNGGNLVASNQSPQSIDLKSTGHIFDRKGSIRLCNEQMPKGRNLIKDLVNAAKMKSLQLNEQQQ